MPKADNKKWPDEHLEQLRILAAMGMTTREIGERLGYSKMAVCGKLFRNKIQIAQSIKVNNGRTRATGQYRKTKPTDDYPPKTPIGEGCLWPIGDKWCGCACKNGDPYCPEHAKIAYTGEKYNPMSDIKFILWADKNHSRNAF